MKKLILTALLSVNVIAFGQFDNSGNIFNNNSTTASSQSAVTVSPTAAIGDPVVVAANPGNNGNGNGNGNGNEHANCTTWWANYNAALAAGDMVEARKWYDKIADDPKCGTPPDFGTPVSINGVVYPLLATAFFGMLAFRRRIAGILS